MSREILQDIIGNFSPEKFTRFFREKSRAFATRSEKLAHHNDDHFKQGQKLGEISFPDKAEQLIVCTFCANQPLSERSGKKSQYEKSKKILKEIQSDAGIFIFYDRQGNFRFSLIYANYLGTRRDWSNFRRFTYFVSNSKEFTNKTFLKQIGDGKFSSLEKIKDAFSVEKVTKSFYTDIAHWHFWAVQNSKFPKDAENEDNGRNIAIIRMITRLIFIWFMREKGLIRKDLFDCQNISELLKDLSPEKTTYYKAILQNLFFATLNTKIKDREFRFKITGWKNSNYMDHRIYRYEDHFKNQEDMLEIFKDIPFLNGGLFDCLDIPSKKNNSQGEIRIDGFSDKEKGLKVPNFLFFSGEKDVDLNKEYGTKNKKHKVRGLIDILSSYNFTIDENDPNDQEVALDPELLGKVFENLLASFNPETASTARKATGSYYTPREIVDYMVTQSLKEYFKTHLKDIDKLDEKLNTIFSSETEQNPFSVPDTKRMVKLIDDLRIVDPAVGSGAFPMGILNRLVFILSKLDPDNKLWKETQMNAVKASVTDPVIKKDLKDHIAKRFAEKNLDYGRKLYLIQKCIYGVDIQQIAVEIAKLRFFISLLVDEKIGKGKENWGIEPLPNLDFKIMQGNSLISEFMGINFDADEKENSGQFVFEDETTNLIKAFQQKKNEFQDEPEKNKKDKIKQEIEDLIIDIFEAKLKNQKAGYFRKLETIEEKHSRFPNEKQREESINREKQVLYKKEGFNLEAAEKQLRDFTSGQKTKPFFAWKLYFAEVFHDQNPGFDIVIANPPYVRQEDIKDQKSALQSTGYEVYSSTSDLYTYFYERSYKILKKEGLSTFITSNKWMRTKYGGKLRNFFKVNTKVISLIDFGGHKIFEATVDTNILLFQKIKPLPEYLAPYINIGSDFTGENLDEYASKKKQSIEQNELSNTGWTLADDKVLALKKKIEKIGTPLKNWDVKIYRGIITGFNEAFIIDTETKEKLCKEDPKSAEILKPILRGRNIGRHYYKWAGLWVIIVKFGFWKELNNYPVIKKHLMQYERQLKNRGQCRYSRGGKVNNINTEYTGQHHWLELDNNPKDNYLSEFEKEKIVYPDIAERLSFVYEHGTNFVNNTVYFINSGNKYLLTILNSLLMDFYYRQISSQLSTKAVRSFTIYIEQLPIPKISERQQKPFINFVDTILSIREQYGYPLSDGASEKVRELEHQIDRMVYKLYGLTEDEIAIVENGAIKQKFVRKKYRNTISRNI